MSILTKRDIPAAIVVLVSAILFVVLASMSEGSYGGADSFMHYLIARYAFSNPELLLDHWGKPIFTLLAAPFAQFGFIGVRIFNISCGLLASVLAYQSAKKIGLKYPLIAMILSLYATLGLPVYLSGLTEPLFALVLIASIYFWLCEKYLLSAFIISWIILVRTEGFLFIPLYVMGLIVLKKFKAIPLLFLGSLVYSTAGWIALDDFFWIFNGSPYGSEPIYGKGDIFHFWNYRNETFGAVYIILFLIGLAGFIFHFFNQKYSIKSVINWLLLIGCFIGYFSAHSVVWALGTGSSAGLTRVMIGIIPVGSVVAASALEILNAIPKLREYQQVITLPIALIIAGFQLYPITQGGSHLSIPSKWGVEEQELQKAADYIKANDYTENYIVYYNPIIAFLLDLNPFTVDHSKEKVYRALMPEYKLEKGTILVYDNHFGPGEGALPEDVLEQSSHFKLLTKYETESAHKGSDGVSYHVSIYEKID